MARKISTRISPEERRAQAEALQASIAQQVEDLRSSEQWVRFLDFTASFHRYSLNNALLILSQNPDATRVAGFRQWQAKGRQVRKGQKAIRIFGFAQKKVSADEDTDGEQVETSETGQKTITYYPILSVFDISQTDPADGTDDVAVVSQRLTGDDPLGVVDAVRDYLTAQGWTLDREAIPGEINGYATIDGTRRVVVDVDLAPAHAAKTALHEAAHVILHADEDQAEYIAHRGIKETEAESVAYVVAGLLGLDTSSYSIGYVAGWSHGDAETIKGTAARVLHAVHTLADAIVTDEDAATDTAA